MKILVYDHQGRNGTRVKARTRWMGGDKGGCCVHDVRSDNPLEAQRFAKTEHRERCLTSRSERVRLRYAKGWLQFSTRIRFLRARGRCECAGECGTAHGPRGGQGRCDERQDERASASGARVLLAVAHLNARGGPCTCEPLCTTPEHVKAMCQACHVRYDARRHAASARRTRADRVGQMELGFEATA